MSDRMNCCCGQGRICPSHGDTTPGDRPSSLAAPTGSVIVAVLPEHAKQVTKRLTGKQVRHRKLKGYWDWKLQAFDVPATARPIIADMVIENPDVVAGCDWLGRPISPNAEVSEGGTRDSRTETTADPGRSLH